LVASWIKIVFGEPKMTQPIDIAAILWKHARILANKNIKKPLKLFCNGGQSYLLRLGVDDERWWYWLIFCR